MAEIKQRSISSEGSLLNYELEELAHISKTGNDEDCEDAIYLGTSYVVVIDGATSKTERRWNGKTGGKLAAEILKETFAQIPADATAREAVDRLTAALQRRYEHDQVLETLWRDPVQRATTCFIAVNLARKEVWSVGDCQCFLNQQFLQHAKDIDRIAAEARAMFLEAEIAQGKTIEALLHHDTGREFILPLLKRQMQFQNNPMVRQYGFAVIDGFDVADEGIHTSPLPANIQTIVLASDGYPFLKETLEASEQALQELLRDDPLLFRAYKMTKGITQSYLSFDDRTYVKLKITEK